MHDMEIINLQMRFYIDNKEKKAVRILTTEFREETHKQQFGALQNMEAFVF